MSTYPVLLHTAFDARDCRGLAEFYRQLLGLHDRDGDKPPTDGSPDQVDWLVLLDDDGNRVVTIQMKVDTTPPTWPSEVVPMQMHMDFEVPTLEDLERQRERAEKLGARLLSTRTHVKDAALYVLADPAGHAVRIPRRRTQHLPATSTRRDRHWCRSPRVLSEACVLLTSGHSGCSARPLVVDTEAGSGVPAQGHQACRDGA